MVSVESKKAQGRYFCATVNAAPGLLNDILTLCLSLTPQEVLDMSNAAVPCGFKTFLHLMICVLTWRS